MSSLAVSPSLTSLAVLLKIDEGDEEGLLLRHSSLSPSPSLSLSPAITTAIGCFGFRARGEEECRSSAPASGDDRAQLSAAATTDARRSCRRRRGDKGLCPDTYCPA